VTLVPERPGEVSTEGGLDVCSHVDTISECVARLADVGIHTSLFIDPEEAQVSASCMPGVDMIELNTARYAEHDPSDLARLKRASLQAQELGLEVAAGHGLTHHNLPSLVSAVPEIIEYNIGHSIVGRAVFVGLDRAIRDLLEIIRR